MVVRLIAIQVVAEVLVRDLVYLAMLELPMPLLEADQVVVEAVLLRDPLLKAETVVYLVAAVAAVVLAILEPDLVQADAEPLAV
jgi:hypothetical protein